MNQHEKAAWVRLVVARARQELPRLKKELEALDQMLATSSSLQSGDLERREKLLDRLCDVESKARYPVEIGDEYMSLLAA